MSFENVLHFVKSGLTGGGEDNLDGIDVTEATFMIGSTCTIYTVVESTRMRYDFVSENSGATPDGLTIIQPAGYSGNIRWHKYSAS